MSNISIQFYSFSREETSMRIFGMDCMKYLRLLILIPSKQQIYRSQMFSMY